MADEVTIQLKNPPSGATFWNIALTDADVVFIMDHQNKDINEGRLAIDEAAVFITPDRFIPEYDFPMRVAFLQISRWKDGIVGGTIQHLYYVQSIRPYLWDWDKGAWGDEPDPTYREISIPDYGSYYYNVAAEELHEAVPALALWPLAIIGGLGVLGVGAVVVLSAAMPRE